MALIAFAAFAFAALVLLVIAGSHRRMQAVTVLHAAAYLGLTLYLLSLPSLPVEGAGGGFFFLDHLGVYEIGIASLVFLLAALYAGGYVEGLISDGELRREQLLVFYLSFNILLAVTALSFMADNLALFWIFAELTTFFSAILIAILSTKKNMEASLRYIFVTSVSMLFTFIGLIFLFALSQHSLGDGTLSWTVLLENAARLQPKLLMTAFILVFVGFAAKSGIVPFHTWLPHAHAKAPSAVSAILSGVLLNVGVYGIIRMQAITARTQAAAEVSILLLAFGLFSVALAAFTMLKQKNLKKLIAFSSIEHMGIALLGLGVGTPAAIFWVLFHTLAHSLTKTLLFLSAGIIHRQYHSNKAENMKDVLRLQPVASVGLILGGAAIAGMPPFPIFTSKLFVLLQVGGFSWALMFVVLLMLLVASVALASYLLGMFSRVGEHGEAAHARRYEPGWDMKVPIVAVIAIIAVLGVFFPQGLISLLNQILGDLR